jgi:ABC-type bacteriocin/lantibiotic exporter with double-glycine peptidase domain
MPAYFLTRLEYTLFEKELQVKDEKVSLLQETIQAISMIKMMATERYWYGRVSSVRDREYAILIRARLVGAISGFL